MSDRTLPASPRRRALARRAGLVPHAPTLTTAAAWAGALAALAASGPGLVGRLSDGLGDGLRGAAAAPPRAALGALAWRGLVDAAQLALPILVAAASAALLAHLAQTRAAWLPRRRVRGAPEPPGGAGARVRGALAASLRAAALAAVAVGWLIAAAPALAASLRAPSAASLAGAASLLAGAALTLTATWVGLGAIELVARTLAVARASRMTPAEQREELRAAGRAGLTRPRPSDEARLQLVEATLVVTDDEVAVAIAWHPRRAPAPRVVAARRGPGAGQLQALARRDGVPIRRAPVLARALASDGPGPIPQVRWPELAGLVARVTPP
ncbi:MAG: EscU/YscU/HrcU family type III secretion system export apparatus switch protein [Kofleriaceae bacterium]